MSASCILRSASANGSFALLYSSSNASSGSSSLSSSRKRGCFGGRCDAFAAACTR